MSRLFVFGDSFSHPSDEKDFATYYHSVAKKLDAKCYNFSKNGTGPEYSMIEFNKAMIKFFNTAEGDSTDSTSKPISVSALLI